MEPSFVSNPYVQASSPSSRRIREILDREEASYVSWRKSRKPIRLPHASAKLNSTLKMLTDRHYDSNQAKSSMTPQVSEARADVAGLKKQSQSVADVAPGTVIKRKGALITGGFARSVEILPSLTGEPDPRLKQVQFSNQPLDGAVISIPVPRKAVRRRFQQYLYDFHSRHVFSFAKSEVEELEDAIKLENFKRLSTVVDLDSAHKSSEGASSTRRNSSSDDYSRQESYEWHNECLLSGLGFLSAADYDAIFETHWRLSEAEKEVRDAVDRNRIREIVKRAYRMLLWFFRYYAGNAAYTIASERRAGSNSVTPLGDSLFEIPSQIRLLEDLNVQCVDTARFGVTDSPVKRESLIDFLLNVARMTCTHSSNPNHLRMVVNEGIEMSYAVKALVRDHFGVFAQIQDADHFRVLFLRKPEVFAGVGAVPRRLHAIIETHKLNLTNFFDELGTGACTRSDGVHDKAKAQQRQRSYGIVCTQFLTTLRAINLIIGRGAPPKTDGEASVSGPNGVDEVRAVRIFLSCLPMTMIDSRESEGASTTVTGTVSTEPRELTLSQFIEALLRVAFTWKELQICHGGFDVCPNQMTSDCCRCTLDTAHYAFEVFDDAAEEIFTRIHAYRLKRAQHRASIRIKSMRVKSHRSLHSLVVMAAQRTPTRLLPVDGSTSTNDAA